MKQRHFKVGKRVYSNPSVVHLMEVHREVSQDPEEIIRHLARNEIADARNYGLNGPPFDPRILASIMGIQHEESKQLIHSEDAELQPIEKESKDLIIRYNPDKPKARQNFSIAHEIAHTLFPEYRNQYKANHKIGKFNPDSEVEFLCDLGASELIMPTPKFDLDVRSMGVSLKSLQQLSKLYEASLEATAIRMIRTGIVPCALIVLDYNHKPTEKSKIEEMEFQAKYQQKLFDDYSWEPPPIKLRVQYSIQAKHFSVYIPPHKSIEESSPLYEVSVTRKPFQGNLTLNFKNRIFDMYAEAIALARTNNISLGSRVLAILFSK